MPFFDVKAQRKVIITERTSVSIEADNLKTAEKEADKALLRAEWVEDDLAEVNILDREITSVEEIVEGDEKLPEEMT